MKIALASDVHLEFGGIVFENTENADVLVLSGDIITAAQLGPHDDDPYELLGETISKQWHEFFQNCCAQFPHVVYVMGNHEHYNGDFSKTENILRERLGYLENLHFLEKQMMLIGDTVFYGGTLWTDMNAEDPNTMYHVQFRMNDYRVLNTPNEVRFTDEDGNPHSRPGHLMPEDTVVEHKAFLAGLKECLEIYKDMNFVVVGHHSPSKQSTKPKYERDYLLNGAYSSDLTEFILEHPQIKMWTHGHTHHNFDYMIGSTRIVCNPRGYIGYERQANNWELQYFDV